jgi:hypothetical protein
MIFSSEFVDKYATPSADGQGKTSIARDLLFAVCREIALHTKAKYKQIKTFLI